MLRFKSLDALESLRKSLMIFKDNHIVIYILMSVVLNVYTYTLIHLLSLHLDKKI